MMKVALYIDDRGIEGMDLSNCKEGNPGVGGTQFEFCLLAGYLSEIGINTAVLHHHNNRFPTQCKTIIVGDINDALKYAKKYDIFVCNATIPNIVHRINAAEVNTVLWSHNYLRPNALQIANKSKYIKAIVAISKEQQLAMRVFSKKVVLINNMISNITSNKLSDQKSKKVTYIGSLVESKGFHILAKEWPKIKRRIPTAQLYVIGAGNLYSRNDKLGPRGIASEQYEKKIMEYLGKSVSSVHFQLNMGLEKNSIIEQTTVGVVNPSGRTETFGISALDFSCFGVPVVGNCPSIKKINGYRIITSIGMRRTIIKLLKNDAIEFNGASAIEYARQFSVERIGPIWVELFNGIVA